ncbi:MAG TPA: ABC transporter permease [Streptosporangiaceae bacterium]|jgi:ABC-2 type transport system permease protein
MSAEHETSAALDGRPGEAAAELPDWRPTAAREVTAGRRTGPVPSWFRFFASELRILLGRPRTLALLGLLAAVPVLFGVVFRLESSTTVGGPLFLNQVAGSGVFLALAVLLLMLMLLMLPFSVAVVAGDSIAGEANLGTLRGLLTVPVGRTRLLAVKYAAIVVFSLAACLVVSLVSLIVGLILFPDGQVTLLSGSTVPLGVGVFRVLLVTLYVAAAMASLGAIGLAASTLTRHPVGAIAVGVVVIIVSEVCDQVPQFSAIHPYLPSHWWLTWDGLFRSPVDWSGVQHGLVSFVVYAVIFWTIAWARLTSADIAS